MADSSNNKESRKILRTFSASSFLNDMGSDMLQPIWPFFVTGVLGASAQFLGFIDGIGDACVALSQVFSGYLSDRIRRKKIFIWLGYTLAALGKFGYFISYSPKMLIPSKVLDRMGKMRDAPRDAYLASVEPVDKRGRAFGVLRTFDNFGSFVGVILTIILIVYLPLRTIIFLAIIPSVVAAILVIAFIRQEHDHVRVFKGLAIKDFNKNLVLLLISTSIFTLSAFSFSFLLLASNKLGFSIINAPLLFLVFTAVVAITALPFGKLSDRVGRKPVIGLSYLFWALAALGFVLFHSKILIVVLFITYGLHRGAYEPVFKTFITELAPENLRASVIGVFQLMIGLLAFPASAVAGWLWQTFSFRAPFALSLILAGWALLVLLFVKEKRAVRPISST